MDIHKLFSFPAVTKARLRIFIKDYRRNKSRLTFSATHKARGPQFRRLRKAKSTEASRGSGGDFAVEAPGGGN